MVLKEKMGVAAVRLAVTVLAGGSLFATAAQAQTAAAPEIQRVIVTGSNIARISAEGPTPVEIVNRAEIAKSGASTVVELLSKLPSVGVQLEGNSRSSFAGGASSVALRGMDAKYTLILLNGRRLANYGFADGAENSFVDLNSLPLAAIDSVEILRDGASAIYGSDAVAGVINFRTRRDYQGLEVTGNIGANAKGDGSTGNVSATKGWGDIEQDGYNVLLSVDAFKRNSIYSDKHSATENPDYRGVGGTDGRKTMEHLGWVSNYSNADDGYVIPGCKGSVGTTDTGDQVCFTNPRRYLTPQLSRFGVSTIVTKRLSGKDELFAEFGFNHNQSTYQKDYASFDSQLLVPTAGTVNPGVLGLPGADGNNKGFKPGNQLQVRHAITEAGHQVKTTTGNTQRLVGGWRGSVAGWDSELSANLNQNKLVDESSNALLVAESKAALTAGILGKGGYNPFIENNPSSIVDPMLTTLRREATSRLGALEWKMSNAELFSFQGRPVGFAWGAQASHESIDDVADPRTAAGKIVGTGATSAKASRSLYSIYGEFNVPVLADVEMQLALRGDHYSDFGNSVNPKLALAWRPSEQVLLRGAATTSFKAPTLQEIGATTTAYATVADWARCGPLHYVGSSCSYSPKDYMVGNPDLKPELAANYSLGLVLQPTKALSLSLDWYGVHQRDTIQSLDAQYLVDNEDKIPGYAALVGRDPRNAALEAANPGLNKGRINNITTPYTNVGKTITSGLDFDLKYDLDLGANGKLRFRETNNYSLKFDQSIAPGETPSDRRDGLYHPKWKNSFRVAYELGDKEYGLTARTSASTLNITDPTYSQDAAVTNRRIPSYTVWDANFNLKASKQLRLNMGVNNVFDKAMVYANTAYSDTYVQGLNDLVGRYVYINARYTFK